MALVLFLAFSLLLQGGLGIGGLICEELPQEMCSYAISSTGKRCLLETDETSNLQCRTSGVIVKNEMRDHIESDGCIRACGLDRYVVGISSDTLIDSRSLSAICNPDCSQNCPNIVDLYNDLAVAEGAELSEMCKALQNSPRRMMMMSKVRSSGYASAPLSGAALQALSPASIESFMLGAYAPAPL